MSHMLSKAAGNPVVLILVLWTAGLGAAAQYAKLSVIFDQLPLLYPQVGAAAGWAVSLVGAVGIVFGVVAGVLVGRIGLRPAILWGLWLGAVVSAVQGFLPSFPVFLALRGLEGLSHLGLVVAVPTLIAQVAPPARRGWALTLWGTFFGVAFALMAWLGLPFAAAYGVGALFWAHGVYLAVFALILSPMLRGVDVAPETGAVPGLSDGLIRAHTALYRSPFVAAPALGWVFYTFCFVSILTVIPPYIDPSIRALIMGAMPLMSIVVSMTFGVWMLRGFSAVTVVCAGFGIAALSLVWLWVQPGAPLACLILAGAMGLTQGATFAAVPQLNASASAQAQANGAMAQMGNLGNTLGTPVMALCVGAMGYAALPIVAGGAMVAGLAVHAALGAARRRAA